MTETTEIAVAEHQPPAQQAMQLLYDIVQASRDPSVDAGKTQALANLAMAMQDREAERRFRMAKHKALMDMPRITKAGAITNKAGGIQSRYSKWEDIDRATRPILSKNNLILSFNIGHEGQMVTVQPVLAYSDGELAYEERGDHMVLAVDTTGSKNATQGAGSAASYGKRHSAKAILNIIEEGEDDDGRGTAATSYETLPDNLKELIDLSREKAKDGTAGYAAWFKSLGREEAGFLAFNRSETGATWHEQNKAAAAAFDGDGK